MEHTLSKMLGQGLCFITASCPKFLLKILATLKQPKNVKSINDTTVSHLVSCHVIPRPTTIKGREKEVF